MVMSILTYIISVRFKWGLVCKILVGNSAYITKTMNIDRGGENKNDDDDNFSKEEDKEKAAWNEEGGKGRKLKVIFLESL